VKRWLKRAAFALLALVVLLIVAVAGIYGVSSRAMAKDWNAVPLDSISVPRDSASVARGYHIAIAITKCVGCHSPGLVGQAMIEDPAFGRLVASNLTTGRGGALSSYSDAQLARALRHGVAWNGRPLLFMPAQEFRLLSDDDLQALLAYIRSIPPADNEMAPTRIGPLARILYVFGQLPDLIPAAMIDHDAPRPATVPAGETAAYGAYLMGVGGCTGCHGAGLSGGRIPGTPPDIPPATNITPTGIGAWAEADFFRAMREGKRPDGTDINAFMPWQLAGQMTDAELRALWLHLKTVPARETGTR
jgi:mono/diheme cytochrome c family protein